jgi:hypothetical protein
MKSFNVGDEIKFRTILFEKEGAGIFIQFADDSTIKYKSQKAMANIILVQKFGLENGK